MDIYDIDKASRDFYVMPNFHAHHEYEIYIQISGKRTIITENKLYELKKNEIVILPPNLFHKAEGYKYDKYSVNISASLLDKEQISLLDAIVEQIIVVPNDKLQFFSFLVSSLYSEFSANHNYTYRSKCILSYIILFISEIANKQLHIRNPIHAEKNTPPLLLKALNLIHKNIDTITFSELSKELFLSKNTLTYNFKKYLNTTVNDYIVKQKIENVKYWLGDKHKTITQIAEMCGFSSSNYLGLVFKKYENMSPSEFRKNFYEASR